MAKLSELINPGDINQMSFYGPWVNYMLGLYLCLPVIAYIILPFFFPGRAHRGPRSIQIFVLGDLGHSPRMCYHARSFANLDYVVNLCGYLESEIPLDLIDHPSIDISSIPVIKNTMRLPFILFAGQKILLQFYYILQLLFESRGTNYILIQNPPSIPILFIVIVFIKLFSRETQLIVDWHNLNYSILNLRFHNESHPLVVILKYYEKWLGKFAALNLTVTKSMKKFLVKEFGFSKDKIVVLYDRPGDQFHPLEELEYTEEEIKLHQVFEGIDSSYKVLISSTSFTPDEDFNILLDALKLYDDSDSSTPLFLLVTGKGPLKQQFSQTVGQKKFLSKVVVKTAWLAIEDYPVIIAAADLGISLHTSSSGLDLPMKILDFFGCGIPVISLDFPSISELVKDGSNGLIVKAHEKSSEPEELCKLITLAITDKSLNSKIKAAALNESKLRWSANWNTTLADVFQYR